MRPRDPHSALRLPARRRKASRIAALFPLLLAGLIVATSRPATAQALGAAGANGANSVDGSDNADPMACNLVDATLLGNPTAPAMPAPIQLVTVAEALLTYDVFVGPPLPPADFEPFPRPSVMPPLAFSKSLGVPKTPFGKQIYKVALRHSLNPQLVAAVIERESAFNPRAHSSKGAFGLMQLLPATARRFGVKRREIMNPVRNLEAGARYLKWLAERFEGDTLLVLAAYNAGEGSVERFGGVPPFHETRDYVQHIFARLGIDVQGTRPPAASGEATRAAK